MTHPLPRPTTPLAALLATLALTLLPPTLPTATADPLDWLDDDRTTSQPDDTPPDPGTQDPGQDTSTQDGTDQDDEVCTDCLDDRNDTLRTPDNHPDPQDHADDESTHDGQAGTSAGTGSLDDDRTTDLPPDGPDQDTDTQDTDDEETTVQDLLDLGLGDAVGEVLTSTAEYIARSLGAAAAQLTTIALNMLGATSPDLTADFVYQWAARAFTIALLTALMLALWQIITASLRGHPGRGAAHALAGTATATAASMVFIPVVAALNSGVDALCLALTRTILTDAADLGQQLADLWALATADALTTTAGQLLAVATTGPALAVGLIIFIILALCAVIAGITLILTLLLRELMLYVLVAVLPIALAGLASRTTRTWPRQALSWVLALIVSRLGIVFVLGLGVTILRQRLQEAAATDTAAEAATTLLHHLADLGVATAMLLLAAFAPWVCFRFFDFLGEDAVAYAHDAVHQGVRRGGQVVGRTTQAVLTAGAAAGGAGAAGAGAAGPAAGGAGAAGAGSTGAGAGAGTAGTTTTRAATATRPAGPPAPAPTGQPTTSPAPPSHPAATPQQTATPQPTTAPPDSTHTPRQAPPAPTAPARTAGHTPTSQPAPTQQAPTRPAGTTPPSHHPGTPAPTPPTRQATQQAGTPAPTSPSQATAGHRPTGHQASHHHDDHTRRHGNHDARTHRDRHHHPLQPATTAGFGPGALADDDTPGWEVQ